MMIFGLVGFINSGKTTVGDILHNRFDFVKESFANSLKDAVSVIFGWPRHLLEGDTEESRIFRETEDKWWSNELNYHCVTPRKILQQFGTEAVRGVIGDNVWISSLKRRIDPSLPTVITDVRFVNEIKAIKDLGGYIVWVRRQKLPEWYDTAIKSKDLMSAAYPMIHRSEWDWIGQKIDFEIHNYGTLEDLNHSVDELITESYIEDAFVKGII